MKKRWLFILSCLASALILSACSSEEGNSSGYGQEKATDEVQVDDEKVKESLKDFQNQVSSLIDQYDDDFNKFAETVEKKTEDVSEEDLQALKNKAAQSSEELSNELKNLQIPAELEAYSDQLNGSLDGLAEKLEARSENLNTEDIEGALEKAKVASEDLFTEFEGALGSIYESLGLEKPDFLKETE